METIYPWLKKDIVKEIILKENNGQCDKIIFKMPEIKLKDVDCSYNGKPGCMCGCNGKYSYLEESRKDSSKNRGYNVDDNEISKRSVKFIINKLKKEAQRGIEVIKDYIYILDIENRRYALYLKEVKNN